MNISYATFRKPLLGSALALAGLGAVGQAHATAYSFAHVELKDFKVVFDPTLTTPTLNRTRDTYSAASYSGYLPASDTDPQRLFVTSDAFQSFSGPGTAPAENTWTPFLTGTNYGARADAYSVTNLSQLASVAESNVVNKAAALESGAESANNTGLITFSLATGQKAKVAFNMQKFWDLAANVTQPDDFASASGSAFFILSKTAGGITTNLFRFDALDVSCASGAGDSTSCVNQSGGFLTADSGWSPEIGAGTYRINLRLEATGSETALPADAPEPATISLLGAGLVGLVAARRRKAKADTEAQA
ncbi:PEP-CTERM sorting domain-containing protein [Malikia sp.]|uniref:PEP-CTERM sorting domain-containing protein n=1 Tax=Malikia sp. TaxID=2070706 RepID=UPI002638F592|nr:PEP-CTERM sorting domain-containing protein [Malikia sp.]MDD2728562.1 PEP-CTERM sorting domain-containing protein [Malikia sp.]